MADSDSDLKEALSDSIKNFERLLEEFHPELRTSQVGTVVYVGEGVVRARGLPGVKSEELVFMADQIPGLAFDLNPNEVGIILLDKPDHLPIGSRVTSSGRVLDVPVGDALLGRTVDAIGRPKDDEGSVDSSERRPIERSAPEMMDRSPVEAPLQTGLKVVDALIPIGRGQRELILGDRQTGKTAIALDTIINQRDNEVVCVYCAIGKKNSAVAQFEADLEKHDARDYTTIVVASGEDPPGLQFAAPYAAITMAEFYMDQGRDVLVVFDDLTQHARAYRELSLLLRRPPGREAYPGDIFYIHSRLLERATHLSADKGDGSLTALPIVETQAQNLSAYIPTNLISITDGQIYLSPRLFRKGLLPAVDVGKSVSRVGGKTQLPAYRDVAGDLKLAYSQFEELESFSRFSTRLDEETRRKLARGRRVRESLKQSQYEPLAVIVQLVALLAVTEGLYDEVDVTQLTQIERKLREVARKEFNEIAEKILAGNEFDEDDRAKIIDRLREIVEQETSQEDEERKTSQDNKEEESESGDA